MHHRLDELLSSPGQLEDQVSAVVVRLLPLDQTGIDHAVTCPGRVREVDRQHLGDRRQVHRTVRGQDDQVLNCGMVTVDSRSVVDSAITATKTRDAALAALTWLRDQRSLHRQPWPSPYPGVTAPVAGKQRW